MELGFQRMARCAHLALLLFGMGSAAAASFNVAPLRLEFAPDQRATSMTLSNGDAHPVVVEASVFLWEQRDGKDQLTASNDLIVTPPLVEIPGNGTQVIRIGRRATVTVGALERSYRLMLQEVVPAAESAKSGLHFALRLSIPAFITPRLPDDARTAPHSEWSIATGANDEIVATLRNSGNKHLQLTNLLIEDVPDSAPLARHDEMAYVLAGQASSFVLKAAAPLPPLGTSLTIRAATDAGDQLTRAALTKP